MEKRNDLPVHPHDMERVETLVSDVLRSRQSRTTCIVIGGGDKRLLGHTHIVDLLTKAFAQPHVGYTIFDATLSAALPTKRQATFIRHPKYDDAAFCARLLMLHASGSSIVLVFDEKGFARAAERWSGAAKKLLEFRRDWGCLAPTIVGDILNQPLGAHRHHAGKKTAFVAVTLQKPTRDRLQNLQWISVEQLSRHLEAAAEQAVVQRMDNEVKVVDLTHVLARFQEVQT